MSRLDTVLEQLLLELYGQYAGDTEQKAKDLEQELTTKGVKTRGIKSVSGEWFVIIDTATITKWLEVTGNRLRDLETI